MPRKEGQKGKLLALLRLFERRTDPEHRLSVPQLIRELEKQEIPTERKSLYSDIETLREAGYDIEQQRGRGGGYYLAERQFQLPELKLLVDAVQASRFLTRRKSEQLIRKLEGLASEHQARQLQRQVAVSGRVKTMNESIYYLVDELHTAIAQNRMVTFQYYDWDMEKNRVLRHDGQLYRVSPWVLAWENENYYLIGCTGTGEECVVRHYRVDKMTRLTIVKADRQGCKLFEEFDPAAYARRTFGMFGGPQAKVRLRCAARLAGPVLDRFGMDVTLLPQPDGEHFDVWVDAVLSPPFWGWVCGFGGDIQVLDPPEARTALARLAATMTAQYGEVE